MSCSNSHPTWSAKSCSSCSCRTQEPCLLLYLPPDQGRLETAFNKAMDVLRELVAGGLEYELGISYLLDINSFKDMEKILPAPSTNNARLARLPPLNARAPHHTMIPLLRHPNPALYLMSLRYSTRFRRIIHTLLNISHESTCNLDIAIDLMDKSPC